MEFTPFELNMIARCLRSWIYGEMMRTQSEMYKDDTHLMCLRDAINLYEKVADYVCEEMD